jgi:hypothetical protein
VEILIIKKLYLDIECCHSSGIIRKNENYKYYEYKEWNLRRGSIIGCFGVGIDNTKMISKELVFKQFYGWDSNGINELFGLLNRADMVVTFNGRNFDIPCILDNFLDNEDFKRKMLFELLGDKGKDRDIMDIYMYKIGPNIRGGLKAIAKKFGVKYDVDDNFDIAKESRIFLDWNGFDNESSDRKAKLQEIMDKNKNDIRILPLIEEKMGLFWSGRKDVDLFHKKWEAFYESMERERA